MQPGLAAVAAKVSSPRRPQHEVIGGERWYWKQGRQQVAVAEEAVMRAAQAGHPRSYRVGG
jgi:hypothetical protein